MLALIIIGSFVNVLLFGKGQLGDSFAEVITAFGTLAGSVTGFYFGTRSSQANPSSGGELDGSGGGAGTA